MLITHGTILTFGKKNKILFDGALYIKDGLIQEIGFSDQMGEKYPDQKKIDVHDQLVLPGMIIPHFHIYGTFSRGIPLTEGPAQNFLQNLQKLWWRLDKKLSPEDIRYSAYVALIDCIKSGTTSVFDHHASPSAGSGSLDVLAGVFLELGLRGCLCYEVSDRDGLKIAGQAIEENIRFARRCAKEKSGLLSSKFGLHASFTLTDKTLLTCKEAAHDLGSGFHLHLGEGNTDRTETLKKFGYDSPVKRLEKFGIFNVRTVAAHAIDVSDEELDILKDSQTTVVVNPQSNMKNGVGFADIERLKKSGLSVGLGTDGMTASLFREIQAAELLINHDKRNPGAGSNFIAEVVTDKHTAIASNMFDCGLGELKPGNYADLIFINYQPPTPMNENNFWYHLLFGFGNLPVLSTMVNGKFLMRDREILVCDEKQIFSQAQECAKKLWQRF